MQISFLLSSSLTAPTLSSLNALKSILSHFFRSSHIRIYLKIKKPLFCVLPYFTIYRTPVCVIIFCNKKTHKKCVYIYVCAPDSRKHLIVVNRFFIIVARPIVVSTFYNSRALDSRKLLYNFYIVGHLA